MREQLLKPEQPFELAFERLHLSLAGIGVAVRSPQNTDRRLLLDGADFTPDARVKVDFLHLF